MDERYKAVRMDDGKTFGRHVEWRITDTKTDSRVATCFVSENAELVTAALNTYAQSATGRTTKE